MTFRFLLTAFALGSAAFAQTPPSDPLIFNNHLTGKLPLRLKDPIDLRKPQLSFSGNVTKAREPATRVTPPKSPVKPSPVEMPIVSPDPTVAYSTPVVPPKPGVDYKIATVPEASKNAVAAATPEPR